MDRRSFLGWIGVGTLASSLPLVIIACSDSQNSGTKASADSEHNATAATADDFYLMGISSELENKGFLLNEDIEGKPVMVFRHPETRELIALNPQCTHQKCNLDLDPKTNLLVCPCHDSHFTFDGKVVKPPARKPLDIYEVKQEEYLILVKVS